jgi:hypothetical protein
MSKGQAPGLGIFSRGIAKPKSERDDSEILGQIKFLINAMGHGGDIAFCKNMAKYLVSILTHRGVSGALNAQIDAIYTRALEKELKYNLRPSNGAENPIDDFCQNASSFTTSFNEIFAEALSGQYVNTNELLKYLESDKEEVRKRLQLKAQEALDALDRRVNGTEAQLKRTHADEKRLIQIQNDLTTIEEFCVNHKILVKLDDTEERQACSIAIRDVAKDHSHQAMLTQFKDNLPKEDLTPFMIGYIKEQHTRKEVEAAKEKARMQIVQLEALEKQEFAELHQAITMLKKRRRRDSILGHCLEACEMEVEKDAINSINAHLAALEKDPQLMPKASSFAAAAREDRRGIQIAL